MLIEPGRTSAVYVFVGRPPRHRNEATVARRAQSAQLSGDLESIESG